MRLVGPDIVYLYGVQVQVPRKPCISCLLICKIPAEDSTNPSRACLVVVSVLFVLAILFFPEIFPAQIESTWRHGVTTIVTMKVACWCASQHYSDHKINVSQSTP